LVEVSHYTKKSKPDLKVEFGFWCRRWDIELWVQLAFFTKIKRTTLLDFLGALLFLWCRRWDLNPHDIAATGT